MKRAAIILAASLAVWACSSNEQAEAQHEHEHEATDTTAMASMASDTSIVYTCTMHADVALDKPGTCPECNMLLTMKDAPEGTQYVCPMHEHVMQDGPGRCPDCNMFLVACAPEKAGEMMHEEGTMEAGEAAESGSDM